jgi:hypothetical protein
MHNLPSYCAVYVGVFAWVVLRARDGVWRHLQDVQVPKVAGAADGTAEEGAL